MTRRRVSPLFHPNKEADIQARARIRFSHLYFLKRRSPSAKKAKTRSARSTQQSGTTERTAKSDTAANAPTPTDPDVERLVVRSTDDGWSLIVDELKTPAWTVSTKKKAVSAATETAKDLEAKLVIETAAGKVQKTHDYQASA